MKAYGLNLRERVVKFVSIGSSKVEAARRFNLGRWTVAKYHAKLDILAVKLAKGLLKS